jgi:23S rRNA (uracil1939-C5)-methyltransferase
MVVVDPPRPGLHPRVVEALNQWNVATLAYVSCNPENLARDLLVLTGKYRILSVQPMDFFPHTDHIETAVLLKAKI